MRIHVLSDLHLEFAPFVPPDVGADVIVLAGDIWLKDRGVRWANETFSRPVVYVCGNHEFYGDRIDRVQRECREVAAANVHFLDRSSVEIGGYRFLGATLWTDFELFGEHSRIFAMLEANEKMTDFKRIRVKHGGTYRKFSSGIAAGIHAETCKWLEVEFDRGDPSRTVVVTHHAPHPQSVHPMFEEDLVTAAYVSDLTRLLGRSALWIHGHTHLSFDYTVAGTRVVCNARGYHGIEPNFDFDPAMTVDLP